jgi:catalase
MSRTYPGGLARTGSARAIPQVTNDPLLQARLFSYLDTQLTRLGGANFTQLPVNRPHCPVNDMLRDGMHQTAVHTGLALYRPNSLDGGQPLTADAPDGGYVQVACPVEGVTARTNPVSFCDHFSQAAMFYRSLTPLEQAHIEPTSPASASSARRRPSCPPPSWSSRPLAARWLNGGGRYRGATAGSSLA